MKKPLNYYYDKEADVFYFSSGAPKATDVTVEADDNVRLRLDPKTKRMRGFTLMNASKRFSSRKAAYSLPFSLTQVA